MYVVPSKPFSAFWNIPTAPIFIHVLFMYKCVLR